MNDLTTKLDTLNINKPKNAVSKNGKRPTFYTKTHKPIRAGGVLFIKDDKYLLQKKHKEDGYEYSDFGGKTDSVDNNILDTIIREVKEETNNHIILTSSQLEKAIKKYCLSSKYLLFIIKTNHDFEKKISLMGTQEMNSDIIRTIGWFKPEYKYYHPRLRSFFTKK